MNKIATGKIDKGLIDLDYPLEKNIKNLSEFKNKAYFSLQYVYLIDLDIKKLLMNLKI